MSLIPNTLNFAKNTSIWKELENNLANLFRSKIEIIFPDDWNEKFYEWYQEVEEIAFRKNLRYSFEEVRERLTNDDILFLFILSNNHPEAFILGYSCKIDFKRLFFVDTIAVKKRGQGIGTVLLNYLGKWILLLKKRFEGGGLFVIGGRHANENQSPVWGSWSSDSGGCRGGWGLSSVASASG